jgi:hypothetical protein
VNYFLGGKERRQRIGFEARQDYEFFQVGSGEKGGRRDQHLLYFFFQVGRRGTWKLSGGKRW